MENKKVSFYSYSKENPDEVFEGIIVNEFQDPDDIGSPIYKIKAFGGDYEFVYRSRKELIELANEKASK